MLGDYLFGTHTHTHRLMRLNGWRSYPFTVTKMSAIFICFFFCCHCFSILFHLTRREKKLSLSFRNEYSWFVRQHVFFADVGDSFVFLFLLLFVTSFSNNQRNGKVIYSAQYMQPMYADEEGKLRLKHYPFNLWS